MTFEPTNPIPGEDDDQPVPHQQQREADPYRHPAVSDEARALLASSSKRTRFGRVFVEHLLVEHDALREQLAAATARAESATVLPERWRALIAERDAAVKRAQEAEARLAKRQPIRAEWSTENALCDPSDDPISQELARRQVAKYPNIHTAVLRRQLYAGPWVPADKACRSCGETDRVAGDPPLCSNCAVYGPSAFTRPLAAPRMTVDAAQEARSATLRAEGGVQASGSELEFGSGTAGLSEPEPCDGDCDCQPGQPCLCPERDCYCGPCRVCGDNPQRTNDDTTEDDRG